MGRGEGERPNKIILRNGKTLLGNSPRNVSMEVPVIFSSNNRIYIIKLTRGNSSILIQITAKKLFFELAIN